MERLFTASAHDVFFTPIIMKKSRPAVMICVLCDMGKQKLIEKSFVAEFFHFRPAFIQVVKSMLRRKTVNKNLSMEK